MSGFTKTTCPKCGHTSLTPKKDDGAERPCNSCGETFERKTKIELPPQEKQTHPKSSSTEQDFNPLPYRPKINNRVHSSEEEKSKISPFLYINIMLAISIIIYYLYPQGTQNQLSKLNDKQNQEKGYLEEESLKITRKSNLYSSKPTPWSIPEGGSISSFILTKDRQAFYAIQKTGGETDIYLDGNLVSSGLHNTTISMDGSYVHSRLDRKTKVYSVYLNEDLYIKSTPKIKRLFPGISPDGKFITYKEYVSKGGKEYNYIVVDGVSFENEKITYFSWVGDNDYYVEKNGFHYYNGKKFPVAKTGGTVEVRGYNTRHMHLKHILFSVGNSDEDNSILYLDGKPIFKFSKYYRLNYDRLNEGIIGPIYYELNKKYFIYFKEKNYGPFSNIETIRNSEIFHAVSKNVKYIFYCDKKYEIIGKNFGKPIFNEDKSDFLISYTDGEVRYIAGLRNKVTIPHNLILDKYFFFGDKIGYSYKEDKILKVNIEGKIYNHPNLSVEVLNNGQGILHSYNKEFKNIYSSHFNLKLDLRDIIKIYKDYLYRREKVGDKYYSFLQKDNFKSPYFSSSSNELILQSGDYFVMKVKLKDEGVYRLLINGKPTQYSVDHNIKFRLLKNNGNTLVYGKTNKSLMLGHLKITFDRILHGPVIKGDTVTLYFQKGDKIFKESLSISDLSTFTYKGDIELEPTKTKVIPTKIIKKVEDKEETKDITIKKDQNLKSEKYPEINHPFKRVEVTKEILEDCPISSFNPSQGQILYGDKEIKRDLLFINYFDQNHLVDLSSFKIEVDDTQTKGRKDITKSFSIGKYRADNKTPITLPIVKSDGMLKVHMYIHFKRQNKNEPVKEYKIEWPVLSAKQKSLPVIFESNRTWLEIGRYNKAELYGFNLDNLKTLEIVHQKTGKTFPVIIDRVFKDRKPQSFINSDRMKVGSIMINAPISLVGLHYFKINGTLQKNVPLLAMPINYDNLGFYSEVGDVNVDDVIRDFNRDGRKSGHDLLCLLNPPKDGEYSVREAIYVYKRLLTLSPLHGVKHYTFLKTLEKKVEIKSNKHRNPTAEPDPFAAEPDPFAE